MANFRQIILKLADNGALDREWYLCRYSDVAESGSDPTIHYLHYGRDEGRFPSKEAEDLDRLANTLDVEWYSKRYVDVARSPFEAVEHYLLYGRHEERFPNAEAEIAHKLGSVVDISWYAERYSDVLASRMNPKEHYIKFGHQEGRYPNAAAENLYSEIAAKDAERQTFFQNRNSKMPRILFIENLLPLSIYGAGFPRTQMMLSALLKSNFFVTYYATGQDYGHGEISKKELPVGAEYLVLKGRSSIVELLEERRGFYDCIVVCRPNNMKMVRELRSQRPDVFSGLPLIYDAEAVCISREVARLNLAGEKMQGSQIERLLREEIDLSDGAAATLVVNDSEAQIFRNHGRENIYVLGHSVELDECSDDFDDRADFLFVGRLAEEESPNVHALHWFISDVLPLLTDMVPERFHVIVVGMNAAPSLKNLPSDRVKFMGPQDDLKPFYRRSRAFIAPTQYAAGIPIKVLEAAAHGLPSVVSDLLHRQLNWPPNGGYLNASGSNQFAMQCAKLYSDETMWRAQRIEALSNASRFCNREDFVKTLKCAIHTCVSVR